MPACYNSFFKFSRIPERPLTLPFAGTSEETAHNTVSRLNTTALVLSGDLLA